MKMKHMGLYLFTAALLLFLSACGGSDGNGDGDNNDGDTVNLDGALRAALSSVSGDIEIKKPRILFPADMQQPASIKYHNGEKALYIQTGNEETVWDLETL